MKIFQKIEIVIDNIMNKITPDLMNSYMLELKPLALAGLIIYFIWLVVPIFLGKSNEALIDIMKKLLVWSIVFSFAFSGSGGWLNQSNKMVQESYKWVAGKTTIYKKLDSNYNSISKTANALYKSDKELVPVAGLVAMVLVLGSYFLLGFVAVALLVMTKMILNILLLALPIAILAILFPIIKSMFSSWLQVFIENTLTVLFLNLIFTVVSKELTTFLQNAATLSSTPNPGNIVMLGFDVAFTILMLLLFIILGKILASRISSSSMIQESMSKIPKM